MSRSRGYQCFDEATLLIEFAATATMLSHARLSWVELLKRFRGILMHRRSRTLVHKWLSFCRSSLWNDIVRALGARAFCVSYSMLTLPVISSTLTFDTPLNLASACLRFSASRSEAHVWHPVQSIFPVFKIILSTVMLSHF